MEYSQYISESSTHLTCAVFVLVPALRFWLNEYTFLGIQLDILCEIAYIEICVC